MVGDEALEQYFVGLYGNTSYPYPYELQWGELKQTPRAGNGREIPGLKPSPPSTQHHNPDQLRPSPSTTRDCHRTESGLRRPWRLPLRLVVDGPRTSQIIPSSRHLTGWAHDDCAAQGGRCDGSQYAMSDTQDTSPARDKGLGHGDTDASVDADVPQLEEEEEQQQQGHLTPTDMGTELVTRQPPQDVSDASSMQTSLVDAAPRGAGSPVDSLASGQGKSPSIHVSRPFVPFSCPSRSETHMAIKGSFMSSPGSSVLPSMATRPDMSSPTPSFRPFDRRFQSRISSASNSPRASSPAFLSGHSRNVSLATNFPFEQADSDTPAPPWEVVRWTRLKKLNGNAFSELGRRNFGSPTCLAVSASIVLGTSKGIILMFDYSQNLKMIIGQGTKGAHSLMPWPLLLSLRADLLSRGIRSRNIDCRLRRPHDHRRRPRER